MGDWSNPDSFQLKALHEALLFAYPTPGDLNTFLVLQMGQSYAQLAPYVANYRDGVVEILLQARGAGWLTKLVQRARLDKPQSPKLLQLDRSFDLTAAEVPASLGRNLEHIVREDGGFNELMLWVNDLESLGYRTCRIECPINVPVGTGWLVGKDLLLTNWHVVQAALPGGIRNAADYVCRFDYAVTSGGTSAGTEVRFAPDWCVDVSPPSTAEMGTGEDAPSTDTLDFALVRLAIAVGDGMSLTGKKRGWVEIKGDEALPKANEIMLVIQYPDGLPMKLTAGDVANTTPDQLRFLHTANTREGSSGSVVLNAKLKPLGLHHAGDALYTFGKIGKPERNQAIPIRPIVERLKLKGKWN